MDESFLVNGYQCCARCQYYDACLLRWLRGERGLADSCCSLCQNAAACYESIPPEMRLDDDPVPADLTEEETMMLALASRAYTCCPRCTQFAVCEIRRGQSDAGRPERCCAACAHLRDCFETRAMLSQR